MKQSPRSIRIGGASAFWGDSAIGLHALIERGNLNYLVFDYLSEVTMALLSRSKLRSADGGAIDEFIEQISPHLKEIEKRKIRVISNAGALNPKALAEKLETVVANQGLSLKVARVSQGDLIDSYTRELSSGRLLFAEPLQSGFLTCNAYMGAEGLVEALSTNPDIVICGRHVDSSSVLAALIHEFKWSWSDWDLLSSGSLAGHLIECGAQVCGGNFTDWQSVPKPYDIGYPIAECFEDGRVRITKPQDSGGKVSLATVSEQLVYEVGNPSRYILPDVICDWSRVKLQELGADVVEVTCAKGQPAPPSLKVIATSFNDYRLDAAIYIAGGNAKLKAESIAENIFKRCENELKRQNLSPLTFWQVDTLGVIENGESEDQSDTVLRIAAASNKIESLELLAKELAPASTNLAPGVASLLGGRPTAKPRVKIHEGYWLKPESLEGKTDFSALIDSHPIHRPPQTLPSPMPLNGEAPLNGPTRTVSLLDLAYARSGDKGSNVNIGVIARRPEWLKYITPCLTEERVLKHLSKFVRGFAASSIDAYPWPGIQAVNLVLNGALGSGGLSNLAIDSQGKSYAQVLLSLPIEIPIGEELKP